jgi:parvulin-like peptidyl-prolyl isomerase
MPSSIGEEASVKRSLVLCVGLSVLLVSTATVLAQDAPQRKAPDALFARIGDMVVTLAEYRQALAVAQRKKYYHAQPPEEELPRFQREVGADVVNRVLLVEEAKRRGLQPDRDVIKSAIAGYEARYKGSPNWEANKEKMIASVTTQMETESLLVRFEKSVRTIREPTEKEALGYYEKHKDLFVEPEQVKLSVILLKVDPSSTQAVWNAAHEEARQVHKRLHGGASFAELAQMHSGDLPAGKGGDMGYVHRSMLPEAVQALVDRLKPGAIAAPVQLLEGVAVLRLDDRKVATQRGFAEVRERAGDLWQREQGEAAWTKLIADLRKQTTVWMDESVFLPLVPQPPVAPKARAG